MIIYYLCRTFILPSLLCLLEGLYHEPLIFFEFLPLASRCPPLHDHRNDSVPCSRASNKRGSSRYGAGSDGTEPVEGECEFFGDHVFFVVKMGGIGEKTCTKSAKENEASSDFVLGGWIR